MDENTIERISNILDKTQSLIQKIEEKLATKLLCFICHQSITHVTAYRLNKIVRKCSKEVNGLAILIDSGGGDIDATAKIVKLLRSHCKRFVTIIPFYAKSAASLLAVDADEIFMCKSAELGPVDPQVRDPITKMFIPASSIKLAIDFIQETQDPFVKLSMADKIPPLLMGAYRGAQQVSKQYIEEAFEKLGNKKSDAVDTFTEKYLSHGYPIDRKMCVDLGLPVKPIPEDLEDEIHELHETYVDLLMELSEAEENVVRKGENLIIQTKEEKCVIINDEKVSFPTGTKKVDKGKMRSKSSRKSASK